MSKKGANRPFTEWPGDGHGKCCKDCGELRPATESTSDRARKDGLSFSCKLHARRRLLRAKDARPGPPKSRYAGEVVVPEGSKWCPDCSTGKPLTGFMRNASAQSGRSAYCKPCHDARGKASKDKVGGSRTYHLKRRYGMSAEEADVMLVEQDRLCAICRAAPSVHVDHDHATGAVRALLCVNCNGRVGQFKDDPGLLHLAALLRPAPPRAAGPRGAAGHHRRVSREAESGVER